MTDAAHRYHRPVDLVRMHSGVNAMSPKVMRQIFRWLKDKHETLSSIFSMDEVQFNELFGETDRYRSNEGKSLCQLLRETTEEAAYKVLEKLEARRFVPLSMLDELYPRDVLGENPPLLYVFGDPSRLSKRGVGFAGSRNVSGEGLRAADLLAASVAKEHGVPVISGHAKGVDVIAHYSALRTGGETILVLPEGALCFRLNNDLRSVWNEEKITIITQFAPNEPWSARNAMTRNGTIIDLSDALCVIEPGDESGGTWAAAVTANDREKTVFVLKYNSPEMNKGLGIEKLLGTSAVTPKTKLVHSFILPITYDGNALQLSFPNISATPMPEKLTQKTLFPIDQ